MKCFLLHLKGSTSSSQLRCGQHKSWGGSPTKFIAAIGTTGSGQRHVHCLLQKVVYLGRNSTGMTLMTPSSDSHPSVGSVDRSEHGHELLSNVYMV